MLRTQVQNNHMLLEACAAHKLISFFIERVNNKIYLTFIYNTFQLVQKTNKIFESRSADPTRFKTALR
jgi:hypothetical protein